LRQAAGDWRRRPAIRQPREVRREAPPRGELEPPRHLPQRHVTSHLQILLDSAQDAGRFSWP
jgi:hypothetical protein